MDLQRTDPVCVVTIPGIAKTAGSKKGFIVRRKTGRLGVAIADDCEKSRDWKTTVGQYAAAVWGEKPLLNVALLVEFHFTLTRPKAHYNKGGKKLSTQGQETPWPIRKPDVLKLTRAAEDALTGIVWSDDAIIVSEILHKSWGPAPRLTISVYLKYPTKQHETDNLPTYPEDIQKYLFS